MSQIQTVVLTDDQWDDLYVPMENPFQQGTRLFETYGDELEFIMSVPAEHVWTQLDGDDGGIYIVNGRHLVNRIGYYFTARPHDPNSVITLCVVAGDCEPDEHEWQAFTPSKAQLESGVPADTVSYVCAKCNADQADLEEEE